MNTASACVLGRFALLSPGTIFYWDFAGTSSGEYRYPRLSGDQECPLDANLSSQIPWNSKIREEEGGQDCDFYLETPEIAFLTNFVTYKKVLWCKLVKGQFSSRLNHVSYRGTCRMPHTWREFLAHYGRAVRKCLVLWAESRYEGNLEGACAMVMDAVLASKAIGMVLI